MRAERRAARDDLAEVGMQLGRPARDVERRDAGPLEEAETRLDHGARHHLGAIRARVDVTVAAGLVAALPHVDLEDLDLGRPEWVEARWAQRVREAPRGGDVGKARALRRPVGERGALLLQRRG